MSEENCSCSRPVRWQLALAEATVHSFLGGRKSSKPSINFQISSAVEIPNKHPTAVIPVGAPW